MGDLIQRLEPCTAIPPLLVDIPKRIQQIILCSSLKNDQNEREKNNA